MILDALKEDNERVKIIRSDLPPVYGATVKAARSAGVTVDKSFRSNFMNDYE